MLGWRANALSTSIACSAWILSSDLADFVSRSCVGLMFYGYQYAMSQAIHTG